jgi:acyl-CoA reductase-like NAD-dependent aldehyde dehydrogenase
MYLPVVGSLHFGHPLAIADSGDDPPDLDFGPVINAAKATELTQEVDLAIQMAATPLYRASLEQGWFLPGQDTSAYLPPVTLLDPPGASTLGHAEPFGPVDTVVLVDSAAELLAEMNASNGCLVVSIACDDEQLAQRFAVEIHAFKIGINKPRSRGDKDEPFGGRGASWKGAFVGGELLVHAVTQGRPAEHLFANFPDYQRYPTV